MKKYRTFLTLLALMLLVPIGARSQETLTVADGTVTSNYYPVYGFYLDGSARSEVLYPASLLEDMVSGSIISGVKFYNSYYTSSSYTFSGSIQMRMQETESAAYASTAFISTTDAATLVYTGTLTIANGEMSITLDNPYTYQGGNLIIDFQVGTSATCATSSCAFKGITTEDYQGAYAGRSLTTPTSRTKFLPKVTFTYEAGSADPTCKKPRNLRLMEVAATTAYLKWDLPSTSNALDVTDYGFEYGPTGSALTVGTCDTLGAILENLEPGTAYTFRLWTNCGSTTSDTLSISFVTRGLPISTFPYSTGFEEGEDVAWELVNGTLTNKWVIGTAVHNGENSTHALYISNDNGVSNDYNTSSATIAYAVRDIEISEDGDYLFSFDWKAWGESTWDYIRAALVPMSVELTAGTTAPSGFSATALPTGWIAIDGGSKLNLDSAQWNRAENPAAVNAGNYKLVFAWRNDSSGGIKPPAAIDNISITKLTCPQPADLAIDSTSLSATALTIQWTERGEATAWEYRLNNEEEWHTVTTNPYTISDLNPGTAYKVTLRARCSEEDSSYTISANFFTECEIIGTDDIPFRETFDEWPSMNPCWKLINPNTYLGLTTMNGNPDGSTPAKGLRMGPTSSGGDQYIVMPEAQSLAGLSLEFFAAKPSSYTSNTTLEMGVMSDTADVESFTVVDTIRPGTSYTYFIKNLSDFASAGNFVAFRCSTTSTTSANKAYLDDIALITTPSCERPDSLTVSDITAYTASLNIYNGEETNTYALTLMTKTDTLELEPVSENVVLLETLRPNTEYRVKVVTSCSDYTYPAQYISFRTECAPLSEEDLPYVMDFEDLSAGATAAFDPCWNKGWIGTDTTKQPQVYSDNSNKVLQFNNSGVTTYPIEYAVMPLIDESMDLSNLEVTFNARRHTTASYHSHLLVAAVDSNAYYTGMSIDTLAQFNFTNTDWEPFIVSLGEYEGSNRYIAFITDYTTTTNYVYIDNVTLQTVPPCRTPRALAVRETSFDGATLQWEGTLESYAYEYGPRGFELGSGETGTSDADTVVLSGLENATTYDFYLWGDCEALDTLMISFTTRDFPIAEFPYSTGFEEGEDVSWDFVNGTTNKWVIGTAAHNGENSTHALYISNDNGTTNAYSHSAAVSYAYRTFEISQPGTYTVSFDWKANGESNYDYLRAFVVPGNPELAPNTFPGESTAPYAFSTAEVPGWTSLGGKLNLSTAYQRAENTLTLSEEGIYNLVFVWCNDGGSGSNPSASVDNISIVKQNCDAPVNFRVSELTSTSIAIEWTPVGESALWELSVDSVPQETTATSFQMEAEPGSNHVFAIRTICGDADTSMAATPLNVHVPMAEPAAVPYSTSFEEDDDNDSWEIFNDTLSNKWFIGSAINHDGEQSLYVSNDNGVSNVYNNNAASLVFASRGINIAEDGDYDVSFYWRANGESTWDYIRAALVPMSVELTASTSLPTGLSSSALPANWIAVDGGSKLNLNTDWTFAENVVTLTAGIYNLVFAWRNDGSSGSNPPAAIDSVSIKAVTCPAPDSLVVSGITENSATISWHVRGSENEWQYRLSSDDEWIDIDANPYTIEGLAASSSYTVELRAACDKSAEDFSTVVTSAPFYTLCGIISELPFEEDFESYATGSTAAFSPCWGKGLFGASTINYPYVNSASNNKYMYFVGQSYSTSSADNVYLVTPEFSEELPLNTLQLTFDAHKYSTYPSHMIVAAVNGTAYTNINAASIDTLGVFDFTNNDFEYFELDLVAYTGTKRHIAFIVPAIGSASSYNYNYVYLDNISVHAAPNCRRPANIQFSDTTTNSITMSWTELGEATTWIYRFSDSAEWVEINTNPYTIENLEPSSTYNVQLRAYCAEGDTSSMARASFNTLCGVTTVSETTSFSQNFNGITAGIPQCWDNSEGTTTTASSKWNYYATGHEGSGLRFNSYSNTNGNTNFLATPEIAIEVPAQLAFWYKNPNGGDFSVFYSTDGGTTKTLIASGLTGASNWTLAEYPLPNTLVNQTINIYFKGTSNYGSNDAYIYLDEVLVEKAPACARPTVTVSAVAESSATVTLAEPNELNHYALALYTGTTLVDSVEVTGNSHEYTTLQSSTAYTLYAYTICTEGNLVAAQPVNFSTTAVPVALPYSTGFEAGQDAGWQFANNSTNGWFIGSAASNGGTNGMYISNDNGTTNAYSNGTTTTSYAYKLFAFETGEYSFSFDWKANGELGTTGTYWDFLRVFLAPGDAELTANAGVTSGTSIPTGWVDLADRLNNVTDWQHIDTVINIASAGNYQIVFCWRNDGSGGDQTPAAIDNISISLNGGVPPVGIDEVEAADIVLYPNPATSNVTLRGVEAGSQVSVVDMNGRMVRDFKAANDNVRIDVSNLAKGAYFVRVVNGNTNAIRKLIVK